ncbi:MAG TPA: hypothetical protein VFV19_06820 [Candidatus Polarisedimenticolaceae bacterium]|nr:hypothetical protein [Candidatus Polarisedimenticolaceae bacterium]
MRTKLRQLGVVLGCVLVAAAAPCRAQQAPAAAPPDGWQFQVTPYVWLVGIDGNIKIGRLGSGGGETSFSDVWSDLHFAWMGAFEARHGRWGALVDTFYADLSIGTSDASVDIKDQFYTALASYRAYDGPVKVDVLLGPRYTHVDADLTLTTGILAGRNASTAIDWWDAIGGARVGWQSSSGWLVTGYGDLGGGGDDRFTWQVLAAGGYRFKKLTTLSFGYRYLSIDYDDGRIVYHITMAGPFVGVGFRF